MKKLFISFLKARQEKKNYEKNWKMSKKKNKKLL